MIDNKEPLGTIAKLSHELGKLPGKIGRAHV